MKELTEYQRKLAETMTEQIVDELTVVDYHEKLPSEIEPKVNPLVDGILEWGKQINFDTLEANSVLMVKINVADAQYAHGFQMGVVKHVLEPRFQLLKDKKITVLFMSSEDDISVLTEKDMEKSGWIKKEPSRIIIP